MAAFLLRRLGQDAATEELSRIELSTDLPVLWFFRDLLADLEDGGCASDVRGRLHHNVLASRGRPDSPTRCCAANSISLLHAAAGAPFRQVDLSGINIPRATLQGADLTGASLAGAGLQGVDLRGRCF